MFGAFGNSAGLLPFSGSVALKALHTVIIFSLALTSRAGGVVINSRILGHNESPFLELCYALLLALRCQGHKRQFQPRISAALAHSSANAQIPGSSPVTSRILPIHPAVHLAPSTSSPALLLLRNVHAFIETVTSMTTKVRTYNKIYMSKYTNTLTYKNHARYKILP